MFHRVLCLLPALLSPVLATNFTVVVNGVASHTIPSTLYGWMFEDISSGDGGLYAEMLQNRAFQQVTPNTTAALEPWTAVNGASISVVTATPSLSSALPNSLKVTVPVGRTGPVGVSNDGYFGINVNESWTYNASFFYRVPVGSTVSGSFTVSLISSSGTTLASATAPVSKTATAWTEVAVKLKPNRSATNTNNTFTVTVNGAFASGQTIFFNLFSLFPPTFKNRANGMRMDIAQALADPKPGFFRFPGGNNLGQTIATRWQWNNTVGPLTERPGRVGDWGYVNTDGLGLKEYLDFLEDVGMQPIMAVWSGFALGGEVVAETDLAPYIQQAIDQINFVVGDPANSTPAALRASLGHPAPYELNFVEIGNEDFFNADSYVYRWRDFVGNLSMAFPNIQFLATTDTFDPILSPNPALYDVHVYQTPSWFAQNSFIYDGFKRNGTKYFEGEYAGISTNANDLFGTPSDGRLTFPDMQSSTGEAAFMTGLERNSDIVFAASYAPLLQNVADFQWTPNLISFDAESVILSTSYHVQKLFSLSKGDEYLPSTLPSSNGTVFWSVTRATESSTVFIKISNTVAAASTLTFTLPFTTVAATGTATVIAGAATASNVPGAANAVVPVTSNIATGKTFAFDSPGFSISVLSVVAK